jgi:hypothetical protein
MPHLDEHECLVRDHAAELSREARQVPKGIHCKRCGSPFGKRDKENLCDDCRRYDFEQWAREKLSPEEIYPEHFPDPDENE